MLYPRTRSRGAVWDWRRAGRLGGSAYLALGGAPTSYPLKTQAACTTRGGGLRCWWGIPPRYCIPSSFSELQARTGTCCRSGTRPCPCIPVCGSRLYPVCRCHGRSSRGSPLPFALCLYGVYSPRWTSPWGISDEFLDRYFYVSVARCMAFRFTRCPLVRCCYIMLWLVCASIALVTIASAGMRRSISF